MSPDSAFFLVVALKMAATAAVVVTASMIAERAGALVGAMVATLPIAAGPAYILLALDHDRQFIADSTVASLAIHSASGIFGMAYVLAAQRASFPIAIAAAVGTWFVCALLVRAVPWSLAGAIVFCGAAYAACVTLAQRFLHARVPPIVRRWFDIPLRAGLVADPASSDRRTRDRRHHRQHHVGPRRLCRRGPDAARRRGAARGAARAVGGARRLGRRQHRDLSCPPAGACGAHACAQPSSDAFLIPPTVIAVRDCP